MSTLPTGSPPVRLPRLAGVTLVVCVAVHLGAALRSMRTTEWVPAWHWALLALVEMAWLVTALTSPSSFTTRNFRLPGVFTVAMGLVVLVPLPSVVWRYGSQIPQDSVLGVTLGFAAAVAVFAVGLRRPPALARDRRPTDRTPSEAILPLGIVVVAVLVLPLWLRSLGTVPLVSLLRGTSAVDAALARDAALGSLSNPILRYAVGTLRNIYLLYAIAWVVAAVAVTRRREIVRRRGRVLVAMVVLGVGGVFALVTTERSILGQMLIAAFVGGVVAARRRLSVGALAALTAGVVAFPVLFGLRAGVGGLEATVRGFTRRVFYVPDDVMIRYFAEFPASTPFLAGRSVPKLSWFTGGETFDLAAFIYTQYFQYDARLVGSANASYLGVGWANGGVLGVVVWSTAVAIGLVLLDRGIDRFPLRSAAALRAVAVIQTVLLTSADVTRTLLGVAPGILDLVAIVAVLATVDRCRQLPARSRGASLPLSRSASDRWPLRPAGARRPANDPAR